MPAVQECIAGRQSCAVVDDADVRLLLQLPRTACPVVRTPGTRTPAYRTHAGLQKCGVHITAYTPHGGLRPGEWPWPHPQMGGAQM